MIKNKKILISILQILIVLIGISFLTFSLTYLSPGDPAEIMLMENGKIPTPELLDHTREELGLNRPFFEQYKIWSLSLLKGDFGKSYSLRRPVIEKIGEAFLPTLGLSLLSLFLMLVISIPLGIIAAVKVNKWQDYVIRSFTFIGNSIPNFWLGLIFLSIFGVMLKWVSVSGGKSGFSSIILPAFTISLAMSAKYIRQVRHVFLEELGKSYVTGARMRGIKEADILLKHILPNTLLPIVTLLGLSFGSLLSGTAVVEIIYNIPGLGSMGVKAVGYRDYPLIQAYVLLTALMYMLINILVDFSYRYLDKRDREEI